MIEKNITKKMINKNNTNIENKKITNKNNIDSIYLHIPFCSRKCEYCDFCTFVNMEKEYEKYCENLIEEIKMYSNNCYNTVYFGGGTPSLLPIDTIKKVLDNINYDKGYKIINGKKIDNTELTLELNPNDMTKEKLESLRKIGINRLSIGIQSFQDHILKFIGREHSGENAIKTFNEAREVGFDNITIDLMFGIPNQSMADLKKDLEIIKKISPDNISIYSLIWEEGTIFWSKLQKGILKEIDQDLEANMYETIIDTLKDIGYSHYEISNFCKKGMSGKHNIKYWQNKKFVGVGMSAASYYDDKRYSNVRTFKKYYDNIANKQKPVDEKTIEIVDKIEKEKLKNMLGLRLVEKGIEYFDDKKVEDLIKKGLLVEFLDENNKKRLRLTRKGLLFANDVFVEFI